ncbi:ABC transporter ATP-binding protein [Vreelandella populi]|uniref:ATP-binding cassette domain-containing protein n=1 Tax=Vreelandella populi TaxID=2498858 RepID=A0A3S0WQJ0_9GAMM|nr:ATP-binding cassette domain-containing protein [Halomonas populi]RUR37989.1 ATP-binding cassette domain-containing protein [Halomonas populi]RUR48967.1 ATP-binding cassette domain-containing protein [Halomonas populi]RUR55310.1 ATP-binding cassette domain-containing protein [Halomonas populi]
MLEACQLCYAFPPQPPLFEDVSLRIEAGEWVGLSGNSGAGKSTLGRLLAGYDEPTAGRIRIEGERFSTKGLRPVQWLPQSPELAVNPRWQVVRVLNEAWEPPEALRRAFGIKSQWLNRPVRTLSGGELQRICVLRALAPGVRYLIADEISTMLDPITQLALWQALKAEAEKRKLGVLVISHDAALLKRLCQRRYHLENARLHAAEHHQLP